MWDLLVLFQPNLESLTTSKFTFDFDFEIDFSVFQKNTWKTYKTTYYVKNYANYS